MKFKQQRQHKKKGDSPVAQELFKYIQQLHNMGNHDRAKLMETKYKHRYGQLPKMEVSANAE